MPANAVYPSLAGRHVFITGGGSGIGAALTAAFTRQGARVAFVDVDDAASQRVVADLEAEHPEHAVTFHHCDIRDVEALRAVIGERERGAGPVHALINNAARDDRHDWRTVSPEYWDDRMRVNLRPQFFAIQAVAPGMARAGGGAIVNFGSVTVKRALGDMPAYVTAKAAAHGLTRTMARDLGGDNIRVNTVVPGAVMTERQLQKWITLDDEAWIQAEQCLKLRLLPEHLAPITLFLAADDSAGCTAQAFVVDAGMS